jgi:hypothetical protein
MGITIYRDRFYTEALQRNDDFLAEFTAAQQHDLRGERAERSSDNEGRIHCSSLLSSKSSSGFGRMAEPETIIGLPFKNGIN